MRTLVIYYSLTNNNEILASEIQRRLGCDMLEIQESRKRTQLTIFLDFLLGRKPEIKPTNVPVEVYDHVILVAPVWFGKVASPMRSFLSQKRSSIRKYSFITMCNGDPGQTAHLAKELNRLLKKRPEAVTELRINDVLPEERKDSIRYSTGHRIHPKDLKYFDLLITGFLRANKTTLEFALP